MKSITIVLMMFMVICTSVSASVSGGVFRHPEHPGKCHFGEGLVLEEGQVSKKHNGECEMVTCFKNEHALVMKCVPQKMREGCMEGKVLQPEAEYPQCCKREIMCKDYYFSR